MKTVSGVATRIKIGQQIKERRERLGLTQQDLADRLEVSRSYVGQVEIGEQNLTLDRMDEIIRALKSKVILKIK